MVLVDYNYYKNTYKGTIINVEDIFVRHEKKAERLIKQLILNNDLSVIPDVQECICTMAETSFSYENANGIVSESVGGHSVTYNASHNQNRKMYDVAFPYIADYMNRRVDIVY